MQIRLCTWHFFWCVRHLYQCVNPFTKLKVVLNVMQSPALFQRELIWCHGSSCRTLCWKAHEGIMCADRKFYFLLHLDSSVGFQILFEGISAWIYSLSYWQYCWWSAISVNVKKVFFSILICSSLVWPMVVGCAHNEIKRSNSFLKLMEIDRTFWGTYWELCLISLLFAVRDTEWNSYRQMISLHQFCNFPTWILQVALFRITLEITVSGGSGGFWTFILDHWANRPELELPPESW